MGCMGDDVKQDTASANYQAELADNINADYAERYERGVENPTLAWLRDDTTYSKVGKRAADNTRDQINAGSELIYRQMKRTGATLGGRQMEALKNRRDLEGSKLMAGQVNLARTAHAGNKDMARHGMIQVGRSVQQGAVDLAGEAASLEAARNQRNAGAQASANASNQQAATTVMGAAMMFSDKNKKKNISDMNTGKALKEVSGMKLKNWEYKPEDVALPGQHRGPMAQQAPDSITNKDKTMINLHDELQLGMGAIQELARKVAQLESRSAA